MKYRIKELIRIRHVLRAVRCIKGESLRIRHRAWLGIAVAMGMNMVAFGISALGQEETLPGAATPLAVTTTISVEQVQNRFKELERATDMEEGQKARLLELYRQIMTRLEAAKSNSEKAVVFRKALETAPRETANIREQLNDQMPSAIERELSVLSPDTTSEQLQQRLTQAQANLASLRGKQADLEKRILEIQNRPAQARSQLTEAKTMLEKIQKELGGPAPSSEASETDQAQRWLLETRQQARVSEIQMIDQEGLLAKAVELGEHTMSRLEELKAKHDCISEVRGRGLMIGIELDIPGADLVSTCLEKGLRINCTHDTVLRFMPALAATKEQIDEAVDILAGVLAEHSPAVHSAQDSPGTSGEDQ